MHQHNTERMWTSSIRTDGAGQHRRSNRRTRRCACWLFGFLLLSFSFLLLLVAIAFNTSNSAIIITGQQQEPVLGQNANPLLLLEQNNTLLPLCVGNLLDRRAYDGIGGVGGDIRRRRLLLPGDHQHCRLMRYTAQPIATCLDALFHQANNNNNNSSSNNNNNNNELLFIFMGDSRIRQQFLNFVKIIPNYDRVTVPSPIPLKYHGDIEMTSRILRLRVSFKWRPLVNDYLIDALRLIRETAVFNRPRNKRPQFILLSMAAWHMLREHGADIHLYQRRMSQLGPILASMADQCGRIIWLRQYTSVDSYGDNDKSNTLVVADKLRHYNQIAFRQFQQRNDDVNLRRSRSGRVELWDSSDPLADEYVRGCSILKRYEHSSHNTQEYATAYANCNDYVHTGYSALSQATQLLFNDLCNAHM